MKAIILAGGKGTRLAPYTTVFPKPLVPIGERPILDIIISQLASYGILDITLTVGYLAELIQAYFQNPGIGLEDVDISYIKEPEPMGTAGSLSLIPELNKTFLVMNGDVLTSLDYSKLINYHKASGGIMTIAMHRKIVKINLGVIETDINCVLTGYIEKPEKKYNVSMGIYVYEPEVLKYIKLGAYLDLPELVLKLIKSGEKVIGYPCDEYWMDIGSHEDYARAQEEFESVKDKILPRTIPE